VTPQKDILVVEDEGGLRELLCYNLRKEGYSCRCCADGAAALSEVRRQQPDLMIVDRMLPKKSGDELITALHREPQTATVPFVMLTAKAEESDQLVGFALGASDYVTKPFSMKVLIARIASVFRRKEAAGDPPERLSGGPIELDGARYDVTVSGTPVCLTTTEFRILRTLMLANGRVLDRGKLIDAVLGPAVAVTDRTIDVHIAALRKKLGDGAAWIHTVRGVGYSFREAHETPAG
jgi:two-component system phosphate regulon response regulator PhoB